MPAGLPKLPTSLLWHLLEHRQDRADYEGRSLWNLVAHLLEMAGQPWWLPASVAGIFARINKGHVLLTLEK